MEFINITRNAVRLSEIGRVIPFLGENVPQHIDTDDIKKSQAFQNLCINKSFLIVSSNDEPIEQNLLRLQQGKCSPLEEPIEVHMSGQFMSNSGYSKANRNLVYAIASSGIKIGINIEDDPCEPMPAHEIENIARFRSNSSTKIQIVSCVPSFAVRPNCEYAILNTTIEASSIPYDFVIECQKFDEIWVVSQFCKNVLEEYGVTKPITLIPNSINTMLYNTKAIPHNFSPNLKRFIFLCVASWGYRKGQDILLKAYLEEFGKDEDVTLLFVCPSKNSNLQSDNVSESIRKATENKDHAQVARIWRSIPEYEMPRVYRACSAFIMTSRGEGFGLPFLEAGACGLPVIATKHGGPTMFLNDENSFLVETDGTEECDIGKTDIHYWDGHLFASINSDMFISRLRKTMRKVFEDYTSAKIKAEKLTNTSKEYSLKLVGEKAAKRIKEIWKKNFTS